jgi:hypothetical protein
MRNTFLGYYYEPDHDDLWENCIFVFDTNVLLDLYSFSKKTTDDFLKSLEDDKVCNRLWLPYHVALEYHINVSEIILTQEKIYDKLINKIQKDINSLKKSVQSIKNPNQSEHRYLDLDDISSQYSEEVTKFEDQVGPLIDKIKYQKLNDDHLSENDIIKDKIADLFERKVGKNYSPSQLQKIYQTGEKRYLKEIPPGYKFKNEKNKFGDLILWFQIMDHAKKESKPIIFVNNQRSEEWWYKDHTDKIIGPRPELIQEFVDETGQNFHMYRLPQFMERLDIFGIKYEEETMDEVSKFNSDRDMVEGTMELLEKLNVHQKRLDKLDRISRSGITLQEYSNILNEREYLQERLDKLDRIARSGMTIEEYDNILNEREYLQERLDKLDRIARSGIILEERSNMPTEREHFQEQLDKLDYAYRSGITLQEYSNILNEMEYLQEQLDKLDRISTSRMSLEEYGNILNEREYFQERLDKLDRIARSKIILEERSNMPTEREHFQEQLDKLDNITNSGPLQKDELMHSNNTKYLKNRKTKKSDKK